MSTKIKAWSPKMWRELGRHKVEPSIGEIIEECKILCRAVFPHKVEANLVFKNDGKAEWEGLSDEQILRWRQALSGWGWLTPGKALNWNTECETSIVRLGVWVWTRDVDGALPDILKQGAVVRKKTLLEKQKTYEIAPIWKQLGISDMPSSLKLEQGDTILSTVTGEDHQTIKKWLDIEKEIAWKKRLVPKLEKWFDKRPVIPHEVREKWLSCWK